MAAFEIKIDDAAAQALFARLEKNAKANDKAMRESALSIKQKVYETFRSARDPWGTPWQALSPLTLKARKRRGNASVQPLIDTGAMYASIEADSGAMHASVSVGGNLPDARAWYNQFGGKAAMRPPTRAFLPIRSIGSVDVPEDWIAPVREIWRKSLDEAAA